MHIVISTHGSRGDVQPMVALGLALRRAGHSALLLVPEDFVDWVRAFGLDAQRLGMATKSFLNRDMVERPVRHLLAQTAVFKQMALEQMEATWRASEGADCIVAAGGSFSAWCAAEARGIPYRMVLYCPQLVENDGWVPPAFGFRLQPRWMNRLFWRLNSVIWKLTLGGAINQGRARLGLPPAVDAWSCMVPKDGRALIAADPQLTPPEVASSATGALYLDEPGALPERLERFLTAFPSPLYVGFGSMPTRHADEVSRIAVRAAASVGRGVVLSRGWAGLGEDVDAEHVCVVEDVPHATLFPRMAAVVHHGGAGTTHAALAAGVPQLVVPHMLDQFFFAHQVWRLGVGPKPIPRRQLGEARLREALQELLDPRTAQKARDAAAAITPSGADALVRRLEAELPAGAMGSSRPVRAIASSMD